PAHAANPYNLLTQSGYRAPPRHTSQATLGVQQDLGAIIDGLKLNGRFAWASWTYGRLSYLGSANQFNAPGRDEEGTLLYAEVKAGSTNLSYDRETGANRPHCRDSNLDYSRTFGSTHSLSAMLLYNQKSYRNLWAATGEGSVPFRNQGLAGRVTYNFDSRY